MLEEHFASVEKHLLALRDLGETAGHALHKGTPREHFVREFLIEHLSKKMSVGTGEIIDSSSKPGQSRPQNDVVLFDPTYPRLSLGGGINCFIVESVVAVIEVKSKLTKAELERAVRNAVKIKALEPHYLEGTFRVGWDPPTPMYYVVAYDGPKRMDTITKWLTQTYSSLGIQYPAWQQKQGYRMHIKGPAIDGVFVLGKGCVLFDNAPASLIADSQREAQPDIKWYYCRTEDRNLHLLFLNLTELVGNVVVKWWDANHYLHDDWGEVRFVAVREHA